MKHDKENKQHIFINNIKKIKKKLYIGATGCMLHQFWGDKLVRQGACRTNFGVTNWCDRVPVALRDSCIETYNFSE